MFRHRVRVFRARQIIVALRITAIGSLADITRRKPSPLPSFPLM